MGGGRKGTTRWWWRARKFAPGEDNGDVDFGTVELGFVHVGDGGFGGGRLDIENVGGATIGHDCVEGGLIRLCRG